MINGSLYKHQQKCVDLVLKDGHDRYAFYLDTGTGKTITSLELIERLDSGLRWLVITPKAVIESWLNDAREHFPDLDIATVARYKKADYFKSIKNCKKADCVNYILKSKNVVIVNPEMVIDRINTNAGSVTRAIRLLEIIAFHSEEMGQGLYYVPENDPLNYIVKQVAKSGHIEEVEEQLFELKDPDDIEVTSKKQKSVFDVKAFDGLVVDESEMLQSGGDGKYEASIAKFCIKLADRCKHVFLLAGTPAPNGPFEFFGQMRCVDPSLFGKSKYEFKQKYGYKDKFNGWHCRKGNESKILELVKKKAIFVKKRDVLDLPPLTILNRIIVESEGAKKQRYSIEEIMNEDGFNISQVMKYRELASGFLYEQDIATGERTGKAIRFSHEKRDYLANELKYIGDYKVIIWIQFDESIDEILTITGRSNTAIAAGRTKSIENELDFFKGKAQYLIAHPKSIGAGVDGLQEVCSYAVFFELPSYGKWYQAISRLERNKQLEKMTVINMVCSGSIEEDMLKAIEKGQEFHDYVKEKLDWKKSC